MKSESSKLRDFSGQNIYVGMDVHHKSWKIHIYSDEFELKSFSQTPDVDKLHSYLTSRYKNANYHMAYEAGFSGFWIQRAFAAKGINCKVVHPADVPTSGIEKLRKTDAVDSKKIAKGLKSGDMDFIHIPDIQLEMDRQLVRNRSQLLKDSTRVKNRIKSILKLQGIVIPAEYRSGTWSKAFIKWLEEIEFGSTSGNMTMRSNINELMFLSEQKRQIDINIKELAKTDRYCSNLQLLLSIPSIGELTGMILLTELGDINRFKRLDELCSYCGIIPNCHSSGETERIGRLTKRGNGIVKRVLIECAWVAVKKDPALLLYYKEQIKRMKGQKAIIKVVRKLLSRIRHVLVTKEEYVIGIIS